MLWNCGALTCMELNLKYILNLKFWNTYSHINVWILNSEGEWNSLSLLYIIIPTKLIWYLMLWAKCLILVFHFQLIHGRCLTLWKLWFICWEKENTIFIFSVTVRNFIQHMMILNYKLSKDTYRWKYTWRLDDTRRW